MGGCLQTGWNRRAKKRRLLLNIARVLRFIQMALLVQFDCKKVGYSRQSDSADAGLVCADVVWTVCCSLKDVLRSIEEHHGVTNVQS